MYICVCPHVTWTQVTWIPASVSWGLDTLEGGQTCVSESSQPQCHACWVTLSHGDPLCTWLCAWGYAEHTCMPPPAPWPLVSAILRVWWGPLTLARKSSCPSQWLRISGPDTGQHPRATADAAPEAARCDEGLWAAGLPSLLIPSLLLTVLCDCGWGCILSDVEVQLGDGRHGSPALCLGFPI